MRKSSGSKPGRDGSRQDRIPFQLQAASIFRHADVHVARPDMTHASEISDSMSVVPDRAVYVVASMGENSHRKNKPNH
jgi:hypothetical protein